MNPFTEFGEKCDVLAPPLIQVIKPYLAGGLVDAFPAERRDQGGVAIGASVGEIVRR